MNQIRSIFSLANVWRNGCEPATPVVFTQYGSQCSFIVAMAEAEAEGRVVNSVVRPLVGKPLTLPPGWHGMPCLSHDISELYIQFD